MKIVELNSTGENAAIKEAVRMLTSGGMVVYPTETCYGIGVDATNPTAVEKLRRFKGARGNKAISVAVADPAMAGRYVRINEMARHLYDEFLPGPITVVSESVGKVAPVLESERQTLGIRIPDYPLVRTLVAAFGKPITSTTANTSGKKPPYSLPDWQRYTTASRQAMVDLFLDAGELPERQPSTVVDTTLNEPTILRQGELRLPASAQTFASSSVAETRTIGKNIMSAYITKLADSPVIIAIQGDLGAGKTQLVKGVATALGITETVNSPTYILMKEYGFRVGKIQGTLHHIDTWRMETAEDLETLGFERLLKPGNVVAIEWLQKVKPTLDELATRLPVIWVDITVPDASHRQIQVLGSRA